MTNQTQEQHSTAQLDLGERPFRRIPSDREFKTYYDIYRKPYQLHVSGCEFLETLKKGDKKDPRYFQKVLVSIFKESPDRTAREWYFQSGDSFIKLGEQRDLRDTKHFAKDFADLVLDYTKSINVWVDVEKVASFVYEALEPFRKRRKDLSELVVGVDFELPKEEGKQ